MAMMLHFLLWAGTLPGISAEARVKVLAQTQRIVAYEGQGGRVTVFDLDLKRQGELTLPNVPAYVCEAAGFIVFNYADKGNVVNLVVVRPDLTGYRTAKGISLYYPNTYQGQLVAYDYYHFFNGEGGYPPLARAFDFANLRYGPTQLFKMPVELSKMRMDPGPFWMFQRDNGQLVICERSHVIYVLDQDYFMSEKITALKIQASPTRIPLTLPGGFQNPGLFRLPQSTSTSHARVLYREWELAKTRIFLAWEGDRGQLYLAFGAVKDRKFQVALLDSGFDVRVIDSYPGSIQAAKGQFLWREERSPNGVAVSKESL